MALFNRMRQATASSTGWNGWNRRRWAGVAAILVLAAFLRLGGISEVGVRFCDGAWYASDARLWHRCARVLLDPQAIRAFLTADKAALQERIDAHGVDFSGRYYKPCQGYTFLAALMMFIVGDSPSALPVTNAVLGTLAVLVLYRLGLALFDRWIALGGALLLAISPYHLVYCRSALADASAGFFVLVGVWLWVVARQSTESRWWRFALSGAALGYAATCHFRSGYVPVVMLFVDVLSLAGRSRPNDSAAAGWRGLIGRWSWLTLGAVTPLLAIQSIFCAARLAAWIVDAYLPVTTFFHAGSRWLMRSVEIEASAGFNSKVIGEFANYFTQWHGVAAGCFALVGLAVVLCRNDLSRLLALIILAPLGVLLFQHNLVARAMATAIPIACLCVAVGGRAAVQVAGGRKARAKLVCAAALTVVVAAPGLTNAWHLRGKNSDVARACAWVEANGGGAVAVPSRCLYWLYLEGTALPVVGEGWLCPRGEPAEVLASLRAAGVRWAITDPQHWHGALESSLFLQREAIDEHLREHVPLVAEFPHISNYRWEFMADGPGLANLAEMERRGGGPIRIYDLGCDSLAAGSP